MQNNPVWFLSWEDPLEKEISTQSSILAFWLENSMDYVVHGVAKSQTWLSNFDLFTYVIDKAVKTQTELK